MKLIYTREALRLVKKKETKTMNGWRRKGRRRQWMAEEKEQKTPKKDNNNNKTRTVNGWLNMTVKQNEFVNTAPLIQCIVWLNSPLSTPPGISVPVFIMKVAQDVKLIELQQPCLFWRNADASWISLCWVDISAASLGGMTSNNAHFSLDSPDFTER